MFYESFLTKFNAVFPLPPVVMTAMKARTEIWGRLRERQSFTFDLAQMNAEMLRGRA